MGDLEYILLLLYVEVPLAISHGSISTFDGQELLPKKKKPFQTIAHSVLLLLLLHPQCTQIFICMIFTYSLLL